MVRKEGLLCLHMIMSERGQVIGAFPKENGSAGEWLSFLMWKEQNSHLPTPTAEAGHLRRAQLGD